MNSQVSLCDPQPNQLFIGGVACAFLLSATMVLFSLPALAAPAPEKWAIWDKADENSGAVIDHSLWQSVLDRYLRTSPDNINRFAYKEVSGAGQKELKDYLRQLAQIDPRDYNSAEQQAYWINLYNALTIEQVLLYPKKKSILRMGEKFFSIGPWDDKIYSLAGEKLALNDIEHRILRPIFQDHRVHYAVNCASIGCPNLGVHAFTGAQLEAQLAAQEQSYVNHARGVELDSRGRLTLSQIYEWYGSDFASDEAGLLAHLAERHATLGEQLANYTGKVKYNYNWDLNTAD